MSLIIIKNMSPIKEKDGPLTINYYKMTINTRHNYINGKLENDFLNFIN